MHRFPSRTKSRSGLLLTLCALAAGCGDSPRQVNAACTEDDGALRAALRAAPAQVRLGGARLSDCLTKGADGDELLRRLDQELVTVDTRARAYRRGKRAGRDGG